MRHELTEIVICNFSKRRVESERKGIVIPLPDTASKQQEPTSMGEGVEIAHCKGETQG